MIWHLTVAIPISFIAWLLFYYFVIGVVLAVPFDYIIYRLYHKRGAYTNKPYRQAVREYRHPVKRYLSSIYGWPLVLVILPRSAYRVHKITKEGRGVNDGWL